MAREYPDALPASYRLEEYEIVRVLGKGGFAITYLAKDSYRDQEVALKEYFPTGLSVRTSGMRVDPAPGSREIFDWGYRRCLDEARVQAKFRHPNIPALHRYFRANGTAYVAMEYVKGSSLADVLASRGSLPIDEWRPWLDPVLDALEHVHGYDYLHRDITPRNILIRETDRQPFLIDFGAARIAAGERTRTVVLTEAYAPIEQHSARARQGPFTDIYSLAAVSYRVLTGKTPPTAPDRAVEDEYVPLAQRVTDAPEWTATVDHALVPAPKDRPQTATEWRRALNAAAAKMWMRGEPVGARDAEGLTALHRAAAGEPLPEVVALLLDEGANLRDTNEAGETPLHSAAGENPNTEVVTLLIDRGASLDALDCRGNTPLHTAAGRNRNPTVLEVLIHRGCGVHQTNRAGAKPLHLAASEGAFGAAQELVLRGASLWSLDGGGCNALHHAAQRDRLRTSQMLLDNGAAITGRPPVDTSAESRLDLGELTGEALLFRWWLAFDSYEPTDGVPIARHDPDWALWYLFVDNHRDVTDWAEATPLHAAAKTNAQRVVRLLLDRGANPRAKDPIGMTPLHLSALYAAVESAAILLDAGSDLNIEDAAGRTPLHFAAWGNSRQVAELLLHRGAKLQTSQHTRSEYWSWRDVLGTRSVLALLLRRVRDSMGSGDRANDQLPEADWADLRPVAETLLHKGNSPLHWAAFGDSLDVAELLLDRGADIHGARSEGPTPLHLAALGNATNTARLLMDRGADACGRDDSPATPLHWAALGNACETMALLIDRGADVIARRPGWTPMFFAALGNARKAMALLLKHGAELGPHNTSGSVVSSLGDWRTARVGCVALERESDRDTLLHWSSLRNATDVVGMLLDRGLDIEAEDIDGRTPLDWAAQGNALGAAELLLERGANIGGATRTEATPLHSAVAANAVAAARLLLDRGADMHAGRSENGTPLHLARSAEVAEALLESGAVVGARTRDGETPLHLAASSNALDVARKLIDHGSDTDARTRPSPSALSDGGATPLHAAAEGKAVEITDLLLEEGADIEARTDECWTPLHVAASEGAHAVAECLLEHGARVNSETRDGETALHLAMRELPSATGNRKQDPDEESQSLLLVKSLLHHRASIRVTDAEGKTPLTHAVCRPAPEVLDLLVDCGIPTSSLLNAAVRRLAKCAWDLSCSVSTASGADSASSVSEANHSEAHDSVLFLLQRGAGVNALDVDKLAPIHVAAGLGVPTVAAFLLDHGADIQCRDDDGNTPLHHAAMYGGSQGLIRLLLDHGADFHTKNGTGKTPLHLTGHTDAYEAAQALLRAGGDASARDEAGRTPLHDAAQGFSLSVSVMLLEHGAALDARDANGNTPLHDAIRGDAWEIAEMLVERGADTKPIDEYNQDWAEEDASIEERLSSAKTDRLHRLVSALRASLCTVLQRIADKRGWLEADREFRAIEERLSDSGVFPRVFNYPSDERDIDLSVEELVSEKDGETLYWYLENNLDVEQTQQVVSALRNTASLDLYRWREMLCL